MVLKADLLNFCGASESHEESGVLEVILKVPFLKASNLSQYESVVRLGGGLQFVLGCREYLRVHC